MKERPILFSGSMVQAIRAGTKTQTRRLLKGSTEYRGPYNPAYVERHRNNPGWAAICPHGEVGTRLWAREAWRTTGDGGRCDHMPPRDLQPHRVWYEADGAAPRDECVGKLRPSMFMPRWASRITLEITGIRVERLNDISEADALAEGVTTIWPDGPRADGGPNHYTIKIGNVSFNAPTAAGVYAMLWSQINGEESWAANPYVWCLEFQPVPAC